MKVCPRCGTLHPDDVEQCPFDGKALSKLQDPYIGRTIGGRYRIVEKLGEGGMGVVYRAVHPSLEKQVAVKFLPMRLAHEEKLKRRFIREARANNVLEHEHIVEVYELEQTDEGIPYIVMEFLDGVPLDSVLNDGPLSVERGLRISRQITQALGPAHAMGIIHRDLKPGNIYLVRRGSDHDFVKILDFGLAHLVHEPRLTEKGAVLGTPEYMSPEQAMGRAVSPQSDLYSLGCTMYEMLCGRPPFLGQPIVKLMLAHIDQEPKPLRKRSQRIPADLSDVVMRLLQKKPQDRFQDAYILLEALDEIKVPGDKKPPKRKRRSSSKDQPTTAEQVPDMAPGSELSTWKRYLDAAKTLSEHSSDKKSVEAMEDLTSKLEEIEEQVEHTSREMEAIERKNRELGRKIRFAIDDLAVELSRRHVEIAARMSKLENLEEDMKREEEKLASLLADSWGAAKHKRGSRLDPDSARNLGEVGQCASRWLEHCESAKREKRNNKSMISQIDDLEFQIDSLKSRFEENQASTKKSLDKLKKKLQRLYSVKTETLEDLSRFSSAFGGRVMLNPDPGAG
jgi:serine/threonine-protein kinase